MDTLLNIQPATPEIVWALLREITERDAKRDAERKVEADRKIDEVWKQIEKTEKQIEKTNQLLGGMSYNQGRFAEEYFFNSFEKGKKNFFGEKFDDIKNNLKGMKTDD